MSRVPASPITEMILSPAEAVLVERQLAEIFEEMRLRGFEAGDPETEHVFFDRATRRTYFIGISGVLEGQANAGQPIDSSSFMVKSFCVSSRRYP
ncbi:hypothetical protein VTN96DRAFT_3198 [Rasamsonia emersonii]